MVHQNLKNFSINAYDSKQVAKSAVKPCSVKEVDENVRGQNNLTGTDNSSLGINEVTQQQVGQINRSILNRSTLLVEVHTLEFRGEKYEDMSQGQGIDRFVLFMAHK